MEEYNFEIDSLIKLCRTFFAIISNDYRCFEHHFSIYLEHVCRSRRHDVFVLQFDTQNFSNLQMQHSTSVRTTKRGEVIFLFLFFRLEK